MARQTGVLTFSGKLGNVIGYYRNGTHFIRRMPEQVRLSPASRNAAARFGIASRKGRLIRQTFVPHLQLPHDGTLVNRLNKFLLKNPHSDNLPLTGFEFNRYASLEQCFMIPLRITGNGTLHIPPAALAPIRTATHLEVKLIAAQIDCNTRQLIHTQTTIQTIDLNKPFTGTTLHIDTNPRHTQVWCLQIQMIVNGRRREDRKGMAAAIIAVCPPLPQLRRHKPTKTHRRPRISRLLPYRPARHRQFAPTGNGQPHQMPTYSLCTHDPPLQPDQ